MAKFCPIVNGKVVYLTCKECDERRCDEQNNVNTALIKKELKNTSCAEEEYDQTNQ